MILLYNYVNNQLYACFMSIEFGQVIFRVAELPAEEDTYLFVVRMSANVAATGTQSMSSCFNLSVERIGYTFANCRLFAVSLTGNALIGIVVYKTRSLRNPVNYFIANIAISDLLFPIFLIPQVLVQLNTNTWLKSMFHLLMIAMQILSSAFIYKTFDRAVCRACKKVQRLVSLLAMLSVYIKKK